MRMTLSDWTLLVLLSILWGGSFFFAAVAVRDLPPLTVVALRTGIAALALLAVLRIRDGMGPFATGMAVPYLRYGIFEQSCALQPVVLGTDHDPERPCRHFECHHAAFLHPRRALFSDRRTRHRA